MKLKVAIFVNHRELLNELKYCMEQKGWVVCAQATDGRTAVNLLAETQPDAMVIDLVLTGLDGYCVLDYAKDKLMHCKSIVLSNFTDDDTVRSVIARGAGYFLAKPIVPENVVKRLEELTERGAVGVSIRERRAFPSIDERISDIFLALGIPVNNIGFKYMREGVKLAVSDPGILDHVTKELYPRIAKSFNTSKQNVERAIRHSLDKTWKQNKLSELTSVFGVRMRYGEQRPTNSEFIALVADRLLLESLERSRD